MLHAFVMVEADPPRISALAEELAGTEGVTEVYSVAGQAADLVAVVRVGRHEDLAEVVTNRVAKLDGVRSTSTLIAFKAYSRRDLEAIWDLGAG
ncbi:MAG: Lrp/AsnC family transcriptional regulator [Acidimicrobiales bacterium]